MKAISLGFLFFAGCFLVVTLAQEDPDCQFLCEDGSWVIGDPPECPAEDPIGLPIYLPFPCHCQKYFQCTNGYLRCQTCPPGTVWNPVKSICDHPIAVNCTATTGGTRPPSTTTPLPTDDGSTTVTSGTSTPPSMTPSQSTTPPTASTSSPAAGSTVATTAST